MIYLVEMTAATDAAGTTTTLRATTAAFFATAPTDTPASTLYLPRVQTAGLFRRDITSPGRLFGRTTPGYGLVELANVDGELDPWLEYGFDGRAITIRVGEDGDAYADFAVVLVGTMDQPQASLSTITIRIRDRLHELDKPLCQTLYTGTNALPAGVDGVEDLKGKRKPMCWGEDGWGMLEPPCVNTSRLIYQVRDGAVSSLSAFDQGVVLLTGTDYTSQSDMETTAPAAGYYRVWPAGGMFRIGSSPSGRVTASGIHQTSSAADYTPAAIASAILQHAGIASGDIDAVDVAALAAAAAYRCGIYVEGDATALDVLDVVLASCGGWYGFDRLGKMRMGRLEQPVAADFTLEPYQVIDLRRQSSDDPGAGVACWKVTVEYCRSYTSLNDSDFAGSVAIANRELWAQPAARVSPTDAAIKSKHLLASELVVQTAINTRSEADTEAARLLALLKVDRGLYIVRARVTQALIAQAELGAAVTVNIDRFGLSDKVCTVTGLLVDPLRNEIELTLWG